MGTKLDLFYYLYLNKILGTKPESKKNIILLYIYLNTTVRQNETKHVHIQTIE